MNLTPSMARTTQSCLKRTAATRSSQSKRLDCEEPPLTYAQGARGDDDGSPTIGTSLHDVCRRAAAKLEIPWPNAPPEKTGSRYEGKSLPRVKSAERQLLPLFPECVEEATRTLSQPFSSKSPIQGGAALECVE